MPVLFSKKCQCVGERNCGDVVLKVIVLAQEREGALALLNCTGEGVVMRARGVSLGLSAVEKLPHALSSRARGDLAALEGLGRSAVAESRAEMVELDKKLAHLVLG